MSQFLPAHHPLLTWDEKAKRVFKLSEAAPHIVLLSAQSNNLKWNTTPILGRLEELSRKIERLKPVKSVVSLGNIQMAQETGHTLSVGTLYESQKFKTHPLPLAKDPLLSPNLISLNQKHTTLFVLPKPDLTQAEHVQLKSQIQEMAQAEFKEAKVQIGGPAAIRTQLVDVLSKEILLFLCLSLLATLFVIKSMFRGWWIVPQITFIIVIANSLALGFMGFMEYSFNILSSTVPILVTICCLSIATHTLIRLASFTNESSERRFNGLFSVLKELSIPHALTALTTSVGFLTLATSEVPLISNYGVLVSVGVLIAASTTLMMIPCLLVWLPWPEPRDFLRETPRYAQWLVSQHRILIPTGIAIVVAATTVGTGLKWTAKLFDDLPKAHSTRQTTDLISKQLGGVASVDFSIGSPTQAGIWKDPKNVTRLRKITQKWRKQKQIGSVTTLADFLATGRGRAHLPKSDKGIAEILFLFGMSTDNPLPQYLSGDEKWTRVAVRLEDLPAQENRRVVRQLKSDLKQTFPGLEVQTSGLAAIVPQVNDQISKELMLGFFTALFWIVMLMCLTFRSVRWSLVAILPNLVPPALLLGGLAAFDVPIKPGIALIFSISLGIAFDNTIYVLQRLRHLLKDPGFKAKADKLSSLQIEELMRTETLPCLVSSLSLWVGFSIFLFSSFPMNNLFGAFMLVSIAGGLFGDLVWLPALLSRFPRLLVPELSRVPFSEELKFVNPISTTADSQLYLIHRENDELTSNTAQVLESKRVKDASGHDIKGEPKNMADKLSQTGVLLLVSFVAMSYSHPVNAAALSAGQILKNVQRSSSPPYETAKLKMTIEESDGSKKERELTLVRRNGKDARALIRLLKPSDLEGLTLLTISKGKEEDQWLYLPSEKKKRRILGSNKKGKFLDSEIAYEDLRASTYKDYKNKILKQGPQQIVVESLAKPKSDATYGRVLTVISLPNYTIHNVEYFDHEGELLKKAEFKDYQPMGKGYWRAQKVLVHNVQDNRRTTMTATQISLNKVKESEVSINALED